MITSECCTKLRLMWLGIFDLKWRHMHSLLNTHIKEYAFYLLLCWLHTGLPNTQMLHVPGSIWTQHASVEPVVGEHENCLRTSYNLIYKHQMIHAHVFHICKSRMQLTKYPLGTLIRKNPDPFILKGKLCGLHHRPSHSRMTVTWSSHQDI